MVKLYQTPMVKLYQTPMIKLYQEELVSLRGYAPLKLPGERRVKERRSLSYITNPPSCKEYIFLLWRGG